MKSLHQLVIIFAFFGYIFCQTCHLRELDMCTATIIVYTHNPSGIATSEAELNEQCSQLRAAEMCVRNYSRKCMTSMQQELIAFSTEKTYQLISQYCTPNSLVRQSFLKNSATCWSKGTTDTRNCVRDFHMALRSRPNAANQEMDLVQASCCSYRRFLDCTRTSLEPRCNKETIDFMHVLLKMALSYLPDVMCHAYQSDDDGSSACSGIEFNDSIIGGKQSGPLSKYFSAYTGLK